MMSFLAKTKRVHNFFVSQALYPLLLSTLFTCILFGGRVYLSRDWVYVFFIWNLFLAWIPYSVSLWTTYIYAYHPRFRWFLLVPAFIWLAFLPNAPYPITDFLHLQPRSEIPLWYDITFFATFAWSGLFLTVFSLRAMQELVKSFAGSIISWFFVVGMIGLSGLGVYLGRFLRWNSWDLVFHPQAILTDILTRLINPFHHLTTFGFTLIFALFLFVCYLTITSARPFSNPDQPS